jgi:hypothetical protein
VRVRWENTSAPRLACSEMKRDDYFTPEERQSANAYIDSLYWAKHGVSAEQGISAARKRRIVRPVEIWVSDIDLCTLANLRADFMIDWVVELGEPLTMELINGMLSKLEARPMAYRRDHYIYVLLSTQADFEQQLQSMVKRIGCELYWRRQLRRAQVQKREAQEQRAGHICAKNMPYVHDVTAARYTERQNANRVMLEQTEIESADGETITLWDAVQSSTANKSIRRGELMTRIRGCEEWATEAGMVGIFTTNTLPSRFHASLFKGGKNPNHNGETPRDGQQWLSKTWARARAKIQRQCIKVFGFRVAEPHHDGCPHWHMLLWVSASQAQQLKNLLRECWLSEEIKAATAARQRYGCMKCGNKKQGQSLFGALNLNGIEYGSEDARFKSESIDPARGGAIAYVAKYISKNIDDFGAVGTEGHFDHQGEQVELIEGGNKARRVTAWASAWGLRQFQAIGQPPVTVWRELRRIDESMAAGASKRLQRAHAAVHKTEGKRADWKAYMHEQGGAMVGRGYQLRLEFDKEQKEGRYGPCEVATPAGVYDVARGVEELCTSTRKKWKPKGTWTPSERHTATVGVWGQLAVLTSFDPTWTRFNNCTQPPPKGNHGKTRNSTGADKKGRQPVRSSMGQVSIARQSHGRGLDGQISGCFPGARS